MKNKKILLWFAVIIGLLSVSIGYAAISKTLVISGDVGSGDDSQLAKNFLVYLSDVEWDAEYFLELYPEVEIDAQIGSNENSLSASFSISNLTQVGAAIVIYYEVTNDSDSFIACGPWVTLGEGTSEGVEFRYHTPSEPSDDYPCYFTGFKVGECYEISVGNSNVAYIEPNGGTQWIMVTIEVMKAPREEQNFHIVLDLEYKVKEE